MLQTHSITGDTVEKRYFRRYSSMLTKIKSLPKKIYYYSEFADNNKKNSYKTWEIIRSDFCKNQLVNPHSLLKLITTLPMTLTPLQINLMNTFAQLAQTWQIP